ncbi:MAG: glycosyl hydrolase [Bacteroidetes bacterium]|nr:MAG: glycosyl hydrolase [Bacteroidota bacterium]
MGLHRYKMGVIGNCSYMAYVDTMADIKWLCLPRFDSSFIFGSLLDEKKGGHFYIQPTEENFTTRQYYMPNTNILCTEFTVSKGKFVVKDCAPRMAIYERIFRPLMIVRKIELLDGDPSVKICCEPKGKYGELVPEIVYGSNHVRFIGFDTQVRLTTDVPLSYIVNTQPFVVDQDHYLVFTYGEPLEAPLEETAEEFIRKTEKYWQNWVKTAYIPYLYQDELIRSSLVLKLHQYEDTGGIIASGTTSLPEYHDSKRNWDYRYCWLRDTYYTLKAFNQVGHFEELEKYFDFIYNILRKADNSLQPLYSITGESNLREYEVDLAGYENNKPVRVGNKAYIQIQNDVYGQVLVSLLPLFTDRRLIWSKRSNYRNIIPWLVKQIERTLKLPDAGVWEFRSRTQIHTYTLLFHWAGSLAAMKIGALFNDKNLIDNANDLATEAHALIEKTYDPVKKVYTQGIGSKDLDASTLSMITMHYLDNDSAKAKSHIAALENELLADHGLFYRYKHYDDFGFPETTFLVCAFWYVESLACVGRVDDAVAILDKLLSFGNHLGIFSEDVSVDGSQWGNFPQSYSHVGLINAVFRIAKKLDKADFM